MEDQKKALKELMLRFKRDTELFSNTEFRKKWGDKLTYTEMEEKWFEENIDTLKLSRTTGAIT